MKISNIKNIITISLVIVIFSAVNSQAQILGFFTAKKGLNSATELANSILINPKLVNIITANLPFQIAGFDLLFYGEYKYSGDSIGMANMWLYTFSPEGDPTSLFQVIVVDAFDVLYPFQIEFDFADYGVEFALDKYIDTNTMLDSDEFTEGLTTDTLFESFQTWLDYGVGNIIGIGAVIDDFKCLEKEKIYWMRYMQCYFTPESSLEYCCVTDYDNINNLVCDSIYNSIEDHLISNISIFPTPTKNFINIFNPADEIINSISIYDVNGKILLVSTNNFTSIDVSVLTTGNYYVCFEVGKKKIFRSLIIQ
jgi:hypothetical protein